MGSVTGSGRSPVAGQGSPLRYACRENPMDRGAWRATVHRTAKSQTRLKRLSRCLWCGRDWGRDTWKGVRGPTPGMDKLELMGDAGR